MDAAGDVIQALATFLNIEYLHSTVYFPKDMDTLREVWIPVGRYHGQPLIKR